MRWLLLLGMFAGLAVRLIAAPVSPELAHASCHPGVAEEVSCCDDPPHHDEHKPGSPASQDHHHLCVCCIIGGLVIDEVNSCRVPLPSSLTIGVQWTQSFLPEGPVFDLDKPPLI